MSEDIPVVQSPSLQDRTAQIEKGRYRPQGIL